MIRRRLFNIATAVSLLLSVATLAIWIETYRTECAFGYTTFEPEGTNWRWRHWQCWLSYNSAFCYQSDLANDVRYERIWAYRPGQWFFESAPAGSTPRVSTTRFQRLWFGWRVDNVKGQFVTSGIQYRVRVPYWAYILVFSILPLRWMLKRWRRRREHECATCSYDLTGNTSGVCPECGMAVSQKSEAVA